jgi:hypothetical protein
MSSYFEQLLKEPGNSMGIGRADPGALKGGKNEQGEQSNDINRLGNMRHLWKGLWHWAWFCRKPPTFSGLPREGTNDRYTTDE